MEVEINPVAPQEEDLNKIIDCLISNPDVQFKSQQRGESELSNNQKREIAIDLHERSKFNFLTRFGKFLQNEHLTHFKQFADATEQGVEMGLLLKNLMRSNDKQHRDTRNRRYEALKRLIQGNSYFSEAEMMKRNPLLYNDLVGKYLSEEEVRLRDRADAEATFVKILMEGIERDEARAMQKQQEEADNAMEEEDSDSDSNDVAFTDLSKEENEAAIATSSTWGEFPGMKDNRVTKAEFYPKKNNLFITATERILLKEEFTTLMHQRFLDGEDEDFDYAAVDNNDEYDNLDIVTHDEEDKYFDSEEPEDAEEVVGNGVDESSEDELDIYMNALNQHPAVCALSKDFKKL